MAKVRVAIDGCGTLTRATILRHLMEPDFQDRAEVVAVADIVRERAQSVAHAYNIPACFGSLTELLEKSDAEMVLVIVPHALHAAHTLEIIRAGRHVYVQKPLASTVTEGKEVVAAAKARKVKLVAAPGQILWPMYHKILEVIRQGEIGKPYLAIPPLMGWGGERIHFPNNPAWFFSDAAGPFRDHGGYGFQTLVTLLGSVKRVTAFSGTGVGHRRWEDTVFPVTGHDNSAALLDFGDSVFGLLPEAWCDSAPGARVLRVHGLMGAVQTEPETFNKLDILPIKATVHRMGKDPIHLETPLESVPFTQGRHPELGHVHVYGDILHLLDCIQEDREPVAGGARAVHFVETIEAMFRAAETGQVQHLTTTDTE